MILISMDESKLKISCNKYVHLSLYNYVFCRLDNTINDVTAVSHGIMNAFC